MENHVWSLYWLSDTGNISQESCKSDKQTSALREIFPVSESQCGLINILHSFSQNILNSFLVCVEAAIQLVSVTETSRGTSDENRLRQRGSGEKRQFSCYVSDWCHTNVWHQSQLSFGLIMLSGKVRIIWPPSWKIECFHFLWGHFLCNYIDSNIHFYINCALLLNFECFNSQE